MSREMEKMSQKLVRWKPFSHHRPFLLIGSFPPSFSRGERWSNRSIALRRVILYLLIVGRDWYWWFFYLSQKQSKCDCQVCFQPNERLKCAFWIQKNNSYTCIYLFYRSISSAAVEIDVKNNIEHISWWGAQQVLGTISPFFHIDIN